MPHLGHPQVKESEVPLCHLWQVLGPAQPWREGGLATEQRKMCFGSVSTFEPNYKEDLGVPRAPLCHGEGQQSRGMGFKGNWPGSSPGYYGETAGDVGQEGKRAGTPAIKHGGGAESKHEIRLRLMTCSSSADVEVYAASEHLTPMSLFQFESDNDSLALQLRSANGCYLAQVRPWLSEQDNP